MATIKRAGAELEMTCKGCGSLVGYTADDVYIDDVGHVGDHLSCPICSRQVNLSEIKPLPPGWGDVLRARAGELGL
jgi:hypothetical protein